jgi:hypothetical protein
MGSKPIFTELLEKPINNVAIVVDGNLSCFASSLGAMEDYVKFIIKDKLVKMLSISQSIEVSNTKIMI